MILVRSMLQAFQAGPSTGASVNLLGAHLGGRVDRGHQGGRAGASTCSSNRRNRSGGGRTILAYGVVSARSCELPVRAGIFEVRTGRDLFPYLLLRHVDAWIRAAAAASSLIRSRSSSVAAPSEPSCLIWDRTGLRSAGRGRCMGSCLRCSTPLRSCLGWMPSRDTCPPMRFAASASAPWFLSSVSSGKSWPGCTSTGRRCWGQHPGSRPGTTGSTSVENLGPSRRQGLQEIADHWLGLFRQIDELDT